MTESIHFPKTLIAGREAGIRERRLYGLLNRYQDKLALNSQTCFCFLSVWIIGVNPYTFMRRWGYLLVRQVLSPLSYTVVSFLLMCVIWGICVHSFGVCVCDMVCVVCVWCGVYVSVCIPLGCVCVSIG